MRRCATAGFCSLLLIAGCKEQDSPAGHARAADQSIAEGRAFLVAGQYDKAAAALQIAVSQLPNDPKPLLLLAEAQQQAGNDSAAILSIRQAAGLVKTADPALKKQLIELYRRDGHTAQAIAALIELRDANQLTDDEVLELSRLQAHSGEVPAAFETLKRIQLKRPDDPGAKVLEAEILLLRGEKDDETRAANVMDRLVDQNVQAARLLRARYFLNNGHPEFAEQDLSAINGEAAQSADVVELRARVLNDLKRYEEAERALRQLVNLQPKNPDLLAQLAETKLFMGQPQEAEALVDQALALRPRFSRALYVRGRALEARGELKQAVENYDFALRTDPGFTPALSRVWRLYQHRGERGEAMAALERLYFMNGASIEEKVALAELYADTGLNVERGKRLIDEALRQSPDNPHYREVRVQLAKHATPPSGNGSGIIIMKGRH